MSPRIPLYLLASALSLGLPSMAKAEGSKGSGGPAGEREDWPCPGCLFVTPPGFDSSGGPVPLLVTFHGDEGYPSYTHGQHVGPAGDEGFMVLSLQCPIERGCDDANPDGDASWWRWKGSEFYDPAWVGQQLDAVEAEYNVELQQVYAAGFSGGASFLSSYAFEQSMRFSAVLYNGGGNRSSIIRNCDSECQIPAYFNIGTEDFLLEGAQELNQGLQDCGHETEFVLVPGVDHTIIREELPGAMAWMAAREHLCRVPDDDGDSDGSGSDTGTSDGSGGESDSSSDGSDSDDSGAGDSDTGPDGSTSGSGSGSGSESGDADSDGPGGTGGENETDGQLTATGGEADGADEGCACRSTPSRSPASSLLLLTPLALVRRKIR